MLASLFSVLFDGFAYGMLLFLLSVGLSVTLGMMNFVNLAHCSFAMVGGYVIVTALVITAILVAALEYTRFGAQVRAAVDNPRMARGLGVDVDRAFAITFALGGGLAGLGGALAIEIVGLDHAFAFTYLVYVLIVVAVGGLGSIGGAFVSPAGIRLQRTAWTEYLPPPRALFFFLLVIAPPLLSP